MNSTADTISRVAIYVRVSTSEQVTDGVSLDAQEQRGRQWADLYGANVVEVIRDEGVSGKTMQRPGVDRLNELIAQGAIDGVVVTELSRLTRSAADFARVVADLTAASVALVSIDNGLNTSDMCGRLVAGIMSYVNQFEREQIAQRTRHGMAEAKRQGRHIGRPPVGFTSKGGRLVPADMDRIALAQRAAGMKAEGMSQRAIAAVFNAEGIATGSAATGTQWYSASVGRLLKAAAVVAA